MSSVVSVTKQGHGNTALRLPCGGSMRLLKVSLSLSGMPYSARDERDNASGRSRQSK
jgi:hypothetical protein